MNILVVCQHFYPENFRVNDLCFELKRRGHEVTVLTGLPNYPQGKVLKEYKWFRNRNQRVEGVEIKRCSLIGRGTTMLQMCMNYMWFAMSASLKAMRLKNKFDLIYVYQLSPITMAWPGIVLKKMRKIPLIVHCLDQWPISVTTGPISKKTFIYRLLHKISVWTYEQADVITISSQSFRDYFEKELKISAKRKGLLYLPSYAENEYADVKYLKNEYFDIVFAGNIGPAQNCRTIIECAKHLKECKSIRFHMVGDGLNKKECEELAEMYKLQNVVFHGYHDISKMKEFYTLADCFVITMMDNQVVNSTLPAKIQSYMLAGKPIVGAISGEVKTVVQEAECGKCTNSGNAKELAQIILQSYQEEELLKKWGENGKAYYNKCFEKEKCISDLEQLFLKISQKEPS